jgi:restriction endonuclease S subunit
LIDECDADIANLTAEIKAAVQRIEALTRELGEKIPIRD